MKMKSRRREFEIQHMNEERERVLQSASQQGVRIVIHSPNHLKYENVNFYPSTGRIYVDGCTAAEEERGAQAFIEFIERRLKAQPPKLVFRSLFDLPKRRRH